MFDINSYCMQLQIAPLKRCPYPIILLYAAQQIGASDCQFVSSAVLNAGHYFCGFCCRLMVLKVRLDMYIARGDFLAFVAFLVVIYNCVISIESLAALYAKVEETQAEKLSLNPRMKQRNTCTIIYILHKKFSVL